MEFLFWAVAGVVALALFFDYTNGFNDAANQVATIVSSRSMAPEPALALAAAGNFIGAYFTGHKVAETIGKGIVDPALLETSAVVGLQVIGAAVVGAIVWNLFTWKWGLPSSSSHALIGGLIGAFVAGWGLEAVNWTKVHKIVGVMFASPVLGLLATALFTRLLLWIVQDAPPRISVFFQRAQALTLFGQAVAHGSNDATKMMGVITFLLLLTGFQSPDPSGEFHVQKWVVISCSAAIMLGTLSGGWRIIKTLGGKLYRVRSVHSFASQVVGGGVIFAASHFGFPISTTQAISSAVMGAGAAFRPKMVRWQVARDMTVAWACTIPASALMAAGCFWIVQKLFPAA